MDLKGTRILITGGAGLIGSHIADLLVGEIGDPHHPEDDVGRAQIGLGQGEILHGRFLRLLSGRLSGPFDQIGRGSPTE